MADTRKDRRAPVSLKVRFKSATVDEFIEHYCKDVSRGGIFIKSSQPMAIGTLLKFQFQLKDESSLIKGVGRVVWVRSPDDAVADQPAGMGIKFIKMDNESKAMVERIVDSQGEEPGAYDEGRETASEAETPSDRPQPSEGFFPDMEPAELPPPEDRTAVRQAAQFLAAAFAEGSTDEEALREAEQKAEEARLRTAQIEAERAVQAGGVKDPSLPSMIIDPSLGSRDEEYSNDEVTVAQVAPSSLLAAASASQPPPAAPKAQPSEAPSATTSGAPRATPSVTPSVGLEVTPAVPTPATSMPPAPPKRSALLPAAILAGVVAVAAYVATREQPPEAEAPLTATHSQGEKAVVTPPAEEDKADPAEEEAPVAEPAEEEEAPAEEAAPEPDVARIELEVKTVPTDAEVFVGGVSQGNAPLTVQLPEGVASTLSARAPGYLEVTREVTLTEKQKAPIKLTLAPLPYVVHVVTEPEGARVSIGSKRGVAPTDLDLGPNFKGTMALTARLPGYESARQPLAESDFVSTSDSMVASVTLTLTPAPTPAPAPVRKPAAQPKPAASDPQDEPAPAPSSPEPDAPEKPAAEPPPAPEKQPEPPQPKPEALPDNPFG